jgi:N-acetylglucosaminyldiphosphoundecaprenol N-acetyl-beta-D-mannosaminyltransferase
MKSTAELQDLIVTQSILGVNVAVSSSDAVVQQSLRWAGQRHSRALFFANVHVIMEAVDDPAFLARLNGADLVNPDGMPLVWALRWLGERGAQRVYGPDTTIAMLTAAETAGVSVGFYGGSPAALESLISAVRLRHPNLNVAFAESPPFRALTSEEDQAAIDRIDSSGARLLFVGLGCPKQEGWITDHVGKVHAVMFAVGAAFDFLSGSKRQAPRWMMRCGLEWAFRLASEPRRLAWRYLKHNPRFVIQFVWQLIARSRRKYSAADTREDFAGPRNRLP